MCWMLSCVLGIKNDIALNIQRCILLVLDIKMELAESVKEKWVIDPAHSEIEFKLKHLMVSNVKGQFPEFESSIYATGDDFMTAYG